MDQQKLDRKERFRNVLKTLDLKRQLVARRLGYKEGYFDQILSGNSDVSESVVLKFSKYYREANPDWILNGTGEMILKNIPRVAEENAEVIVDSFRLNLKPIREHYKISSAQMASDLGIYESKLYDIEMGESGISLALLLEMREHYKLRIDDMLFTDLRAGGIDYARTDYISSPSDIEAFMAHAEKEITDIKAQIAELRNNQDTNA